MGRVTLVVLAYASTASGMTFMDLMKNNKNKTYRYRKSFCEAAEACKANVKASVCKQKHPGNWNDTKSTADKAFLAAHHNTSTSDLNKTTMTETDFKAGWKALREKHSFNSRRRLLADPAADPSFRTRRPIERLAHEISVAVAEDNQ